jgi:phage terminase large subunit-like protein
MVPMGQSLGSFNRCTKSCEIFIKNGSLLIDGTPLIKWAFQNCELKTDAYGNVKPVKANGQISKKIDPVIALLEALGAFLFEQLFGNMEMISLD